VTEGEGVLGGTWTDRSGLGALVRTRGGAQGAVSCSPAADVVVGLGADERSAAIKVTGEALVAAGVGPADRVLLALGLHGEGSGSLLAAAAGELAEATCVVEPRGRTRLLRAINAVAPTTLVVTPTGAMDLLARLHLEFLVDPEELGLERIVVVGELAPPATHRQLATEFAVDLRELWCDPVFGAALAVRDPARDRSFTPVHAEALGLAPLDRDELLDSAEGGADVEWVLRPTWSSQLADVAIRTGLVASVAGGLPPTGDVALPAPSATVGEHVLVRGRWLALVALQRALAGIDGVSGWSLQVSREGTLDQARLEVGLDRPSLLDNPMWAARLADAVRSVTPVAIPVEARSGDDVVRGHEVVDRRPQHLGRDRSHPTGAAPTW
jgi:hypothetical protein